MEIIAGGATEQGRRTSNEDALLIDVEHGLFAVADGMGGHAAGEVASRLALETLQKALTGSSGRATEESVRDAILKASQAVLEAAATDRGKSGMGTTLTMLLVNGDVGIVGHVGDSRLYRVRWGQVEKLTQDHTLVAELIKKGAVDEAQAGKGPWAHILTRVVGGKDALEVETATLDLVSGDRFLLCSDGFSDSLTDPQWLAALERRTPDESAAELVGRAVQLDGHDNATAVVVVLGDREQQELRQSTWQRLTKRVSLALHNLRGDERE